MIPPFFFIRVKKNMVLKGPRTGMELKLYDLTQKVLSETSLELYDMEWNGSSGNLVIYIQNPETGTCLLEDCMTVDRGFNPYCETEDWIPDNLTLEVSSPGLYRPLSTIAHFKAVIGEEILVHLATKIDELKYPDFPKALRNNLKIKVLLQEVSEEGVIVEVKGNVLAIPFTQIKKSNLETDINKENI